MTLHEWSPRPGVRAIGVPTGPAVNGDVLSALAWVNVLTASECTQDTPSEREPASEHTNVFIVCNDIRYFDDALHARMIEPTGVGCTVTVKHSRVFALLT